jgi:hypothetical protein
VYILPEDGHRSGPKHVIVVHNKIDHEKHLFAYGGFNKSISGYTRNRMHNPTIKFKPAFHKSKSSNLSGGCVAFTRGCKNEIQ